MNTTRKIASTDRSQSFGNIIITDETLDRNAIGNNNFIYR